MSSLHGNQKVSAFDLWSLGLSNLLASWWRQNFAGDPVLEMEDYDSAEWVAKRAERLEFFIYESPSAWSPPDCDEKGRANLTPKRKAWHEYARNFAEELITAWHTGPEGRKHFCRALMEEPSGFWCGYAAGDKLLNMEMPFNALQIQVEILEKHFESGYMREECVRFVEREGCPPWMESSNVVQQDALAVSEELFSRWARNYYQLLV